MKLLTCLVATVAGGMVLCTPAVADVHCPKIVFAPQSSDFAYAVSARHVGCGTATAVVRPSAPERYRVPYNFPTYAQTFAVVRRYRKDGFTCVGHGGWVEPTHPGGLDVERYACRRGSARVTFTRA